MKRKKKGWIGGALIGQGTFGCVFKPHLLCDGKQDFKDRKHVSKLIVMRSGDDYRLNNELDIGQLILKSKKYSKYFSPIISTCPIEFEDISDQDKYKCNSANKYMDNKMILAKLKKVNGTNVIDTFDNIRGTEAVYIFFDIYKDEFCISPLKSLSLHLTNINSSYGLSPFIDYKKLWDEN